MGNPKTKEALLIKLKLYRSILVAALGALVFTLSCDRDCPVCPKPPTEPISDYNFYISYFNEGQYYVYIYNTKALNIVDSISLGISLTSHLYDMKVTADGSNLLIAYSDSLYQEILAVYDLGNRDFISSKAIAGQIEISNTGAYIAIMNDSLTFFNAQNFDFLYSDHIAPLGGRFSYDDSRFYAVDSVNQIRIYDMTTRSMYDTMRYNAFLQNPELHLCQPIPDESRIYLWAYFPGWQEFVLVSYDISRDSTGLFYPLGPGVGDLELTPDGSTVIFTDPGDVAHDEFGSDNISFIGVSSDRLLWSAPAGWAITGWTRYGFHPGPLAITPDNRYVMAIGQGGYPIYALVDLQQRRFVDINIDHFMKTAFEQITCQKMSK